MPKNENEEKKTKKKTPERILCFSIRLSPFNFNLIETGGSQSWMCFKELYENIKELCESINVSAYAKKYKFQWIIRFYVMVGIYDKMFSMSTK